MALVKDKPADLKPENDLDAIPADLLGPIPAEIRLGANVLMMMDKPPECGDTITVVMRLKIKREGKELAGDEGQELTHFRLAKIVTAWLKGDPEPPDPNADQPALFDDDGEPTDEPQKLGDITVSVVPDISKPSFSNLTGGSE